ncbi:hypothetical protein AJ80_08687 [Polytolypa hystricis UAMH7299]|uniref:Methyltransferase type 11 domain-containing protein n=1 Tax=Polytolypa hystricis (strain UAMH7299) TaxID=1447883 RepID=A0A2B7X3I0_POLH7|nr:hypothetical protein AJ80_08687 [Polytolypa hystricis UAMH7299]
MPGHLVLAPISPVRQARTGSLNTIIEETHEMDPRGANDANFKAAIVGRPSTPDTNLCLPTSRAAAMTSIKSPVRSATLCSKNAWSRRHSDFDDLYDATDDDGDMSDDCSSIHSPAHSMASNPSYASKYSSSSRNKYPTIVIPPVRSSSMNTLHKNSPVPPTPPPKIPLSPEVLSRLPTTVPALNKPPSLDGSEASDRGSGSSMPQTPELRNSNEVDWSNQQLHVDSEERDVETSSDTMSPQLDIQLQSPEDWSFVVGSFPRIPGQELNVDASPIVRLDREPVSARSERGVELPARAFATLQHIDLDGDEDNDSSNSDTDNVHEMKEVPQSSRRPKSASAALPTSACSYTLTPLSIPSPGGFFSSLEGDARRTWCLRSPNAPSSATAEFFYNCPWNMFPEDAEQYAEELASGTNASSTPTLRPASDDMSNARRASASTAGHSYMTTSVLSIQEPSRSQVPVDEYDESYEEELQGKASANIDRTSVWLAAQSSYLSALRETSSLDEAESPASSTTSSLRRNSSAITRKLSVALATIHEEGAESAPPMVPNKEKLFCQSFYRNAQQARSRDAFLHSKFRLEALQANRLSLRDKHVDQLVGRFAINSPVRPPYRGPFSQAPRNSTMPNILAEQAKYSRLEKEQDVANQLQASMWAIEALKYLNGGRLLPSPASKKLAKATSPLGSPENSGSRRFRALDLGGNTSCDWAWYLSQQYKNVKVYTVVTKQQVVNPDIKGPPNHRRVSVPHLWRLPFRDNQFDVISARSLHTLLKAEKPMGEDIDEFDLCLKECYRVLKPGGYLEFLMMDSEIVRAGPSGSATSVEFGFNLKTRGYDPTPTKPFLGKLRKARFMDIKRAWLFLPMGTVAAESQLPGAPVKDGEQPIGSTADVASTTGLLGGWMWEQWMLKLQMEMGREKGKLLEEVSSVFTEGGKCGAGWRCLNGWAMKPKRTSRVVSTSSDGTIIR